MRDAVAMHFGQNGAGPNDNGGERSRGPTTPCPVLCCPAPPRPPRPRARMKESMAYYTCRAKPRPSPCSLLLQPRAGPRALWGARARWLGQAWRRVEGRVAPVALRAGRAGRCHWGLRVSWWPARGTARRQLAPGGNFSLLGHGHDGLSHGSAQPGVVGVPAAMSAPTLGRARRATWCIQSDPTTWKTSILPRSFQSVRNSPSTPIQKFSIF